VAYALILTGIVLFLATFRGDVAQLGALLKGDILSGNFLYWIGAVIILGSLGYIKALKHFSDLFLVLVIVALVLSNRGVFSQFMIALRQIKSGNCPQNASAASPNALTLEGGSANLANMSSTLNNWDSVLNSQQSALTTSVPSIVSLTVTPGG